MSLLIITPKGLINESPLTARETSILNYLAMGLKQKEIAEKLSITPETVKKHTKNCYKKLGAHNKIEALRKAGIL